VKERLTGAIILVALIVLLVPELLSGPVHSAPRTAALASSAEEPPFRSYTINLADDAHAHPAPSNPSGPQQPAPIPSAAPEADVPGSPHASPASQPPAAEPTPSTRPQAPAPASPAHAPVATTVPDPGNAGSGAYVVQLGSFASRANADRLAQQVHTQGFPVSVSQGSTGRRLYRVRVGPAHDRTAASQLAAQLRASGHSGGSIVPE
jgi:DedD protein